MINVMQFINREHYPDDGESIPFTLGCELCIWFRHRHGVRLCGQLEHVRVLASTDTPKHENCRNQYETHYPSTIYLDALLSVEDEYDFKALRKPYYYY